MFPTAEFVASLKESYLAGKSALDTKAKAEKLLKNYIEEANEILEVEGDSAELTQSRDEYINILAEINAMDAQTWNEFYESKEVAELVTARQQKDRWQKRVNFKLDVNAPIPHRQKSKANHTTELPPVRETEANILKQLRCAFSSLLSYRNLKTYGGMLTLIKRIPPYRYRNFFLQADDFGYSLLHYAAYYPHDLIDILDLLSDADSILTMKFELLNDAVTSINEDAAILKQEVDGIGQDASLLIKETNELMQADQQVMQERNLLIEEMILLNRIAIQNAILQSDSNGRTVLHHAATNQALLQILLTYFDKERHDELLGLHDQCGNSVRDISQISSDDEDESAKQFLADSSSQDAPPPTPTSKNSVTSSIHTSFFNLPALNNHAIADDLGFDLRPIIGDGNCYFSSVSSVLNELRGEHYTPQIVRAAGINYIKSHNSFDAFFGPETDFGEKEEYLSKMAADKVWAQGPIIQAVAMTYGLKLTIVNYRDSNSIHPIHVNDEGVDLPRISLLHTGDQHYDVLIERSNNAFTRVIK